MNPAPLHADKSVPDAWETFRTALVDKTLQAYFVLAWIGLPIFVWRSSVAGWRPSNIFVVLLVLAGMAFHHFGKRASTDIKSMVLVGVFFGLAIPGILNLGLLSNGLLLLASGCMCAALVLSIRTSVTLSVLSFVALAVVGYGFVSGEMAIGTDANAFATSTAAWVTAICVNFLSALILVNSVATFRRSLQSTFLEVQRQRDIIAHQANHDQLTQLPTLSLAADRLDMAIKEAQRDGNKVAVMFIDLDGFKDANDNHGHHAGDRVLGEVARRITRQIRATDTACRIGGDEFLVILRSIPDAAIAAETARKIIDAVGHSIDFEDQKIAIGCSIGIGLFPDHADTPLALRRAADSAMYAVKRSGKNNFTFYDPAAANA